MKIKLFLLATLLAALKLHAADTNTVFYVNLSTDWEYHISNDGNYPKNDTSVHFIGLNANKYEILPYDPSVQAPRKKLRASITIQNYPFIRANWDFENYQGTIYQRPLYPIQGYCKLKSSGTAYDEVGNLDSTSAIYIWQTNTIVPSQITPQARLIVITNQINLYSTNVVALKLQFQKTQNMLTLANRSGNDADSKKYAAEEMVLNNQRVECERRIAALQLEAIKIQDAIESKNEKAVKTHKD